VFESLHGQASSLLVRRGIVLSWRGHQAAPRDRVMIQVAAELLITPILDYLVDGLGLWMQYRNRTDDVHATALIDGRNGPRPVSSTASLNHPVKHCYIAAGRCITFETMRRAVSAACRGGHPGFYRE
jgi:hypothetical protein